MKPAARISAALLICFLGTAFAQAYTLRTLEGRFSVEFPGTPAFNVIRDVGSCMRRRSEYRYSAGGRGWMVSYQDCTPGMLADIGTPQTLRDLAKGVAKTVDGEVRANDPIELRGIPGREVLIRLPANMVIRARYFIDGDRIYQTMYVGQVGTQEDPEVDAFFASFEILR